jgi:type II secretory pathway pseudopilin PulG
VVTVVLGILAAVAVFGIVGADPSSTSVACEASFKTVETAAEAYKAQTGQYPAQLSDLTGQHVGLTGVMEGPWLRDMPDVYTPGPDPSITTNGIYGLSIDPVNNAIAVGTIKANGATADTGTPLVDGDANCSEA